MTISAAPDDASPPPIRGQAIYRLTRGRGEVKHPAYILSFFIAHYQDALRIEPDNAEAHYNWGKALQTLGRPQDAVAHYQAALRIRPDYTYAHNNLAWLLATCPDAAIRDGGQALAHAKRAVELAGNDNAGLLDSL